MVELSFLFGIFSALIVPLAIIATVQYCVLANRELNFKKLILFSWLMVLTFMPTSFGAVLVILTSFNDNPLISLFGEDYRLSSVCFAGDLTYIFFGWLMCSALYGKLILPDIKSDKLDLP